MQKIIFQKKVPRDRLVHHIESENILGKTSNMDEMFESLYKEKRELTESIYDEYKYAGKTSLNIFEINGFPKEINSKSNFLTHVQTKLGKSSILNRKLRPVISEVPQINLIEETEQGYRIQWVHGVVVENTDGYNVITRMDQRLVTTIISFGSPLFIEVRAGFKNAVKYLKLISLLISKDNVPVELTRIPLTKVTEKEAEEIARILEAGLLEGEHLGSNGIGKYAVSADRDTKDLRDLDEYNSRYSGKQYLSQTLNVLYEEVDTGYRTNVKFKINMNGGFEFKSKVSERIIKRVFDVFAEVRYKPVTTS